LGAQEALNRIELQVQALAHIGEIAASLTT
jgi:hypothetical protein